MNSHYKEILATIKLKSGKGTTHTISENYLGSSHPRYAISMPQLRDIAKTWSKNNKELSAKDFADVLTSLIEGPSTTEKIFAGLLLDYATKEQKNFPPILFNSWLNHLEGWAEIDALCTNKYTRTHLLLHWEKWSTLLTRFSKSKSLTKKRASLVLLCSPARQTDDKRILMAALENIEELKHHKEVLITKAISWLLRSLVKYHKNGINQYVKDHQNTLPSIAVRETTTVLKTGTKTKSRKGIEQ